MRSRELLFHPDGSAGGSAGRLAAARPDPFLPDLAPSLNNQSKRLANLGRREEALAALELISRLI